MTDDRWYRIVDGNFQLTPEAPEAAKKSFAEWKSTPKLTMREIFRMLRNKLF